MKITEYIFEIIELFSRDHSIWISYFNSVTDIVNYFMTFTLILMLLYISYKICAFWRLKEVIRSSEDSSNKNYVKRFKNNKDLPPYPNGWIPILESIDIKNKEVKPVSVVGHELVVFRGVSGNVFVLDAFCPHLGANLGYGGKVTQERNDDCIKCPFHGWSFRGKDGICSKIPDLEFTESQFPNARIRVWDSIERNGFVYIWYHVDGQKPTWFPENIDEIENSKFTYQGKIFYIINSHIQEIAENVADTTHFSELHSPIFLKLSPKDKLSRLGKFLSNYIFLITSWNSEWRESDAPNQHKSHMSIDTTITLFGYEIFGMKFLIQQIGPAIVHIKYKAYLLGDVEGALILGTTPLEPNKNKMVNHIYTERTFRAKLISKFLLDFEAKMLDRDVFIWNNKKFLKNPIFTKNDKSVVKFRRWYNQFYSESSLQKLDW